MHTQVFIIEVSAVNAMPTEQEVQNFLQAAFDASDNPADVEVEVVSKDFGDVIALLEE